MGGSEGFEDAATGLCPGGKMLEKWEGHGGLGGQRTGMTSRPMPSPGIRPMWRALLVAIVGLVIQKEDF